MSEHITRKLRAAQKPLTRYLWTPSDAITFTPRVLTKTYGDGRALFGVGTINSRPAYWIIRGCSTWSSGLDCDHPDDATDITEHIDEIVTDLESEFGRAECGYEYEWEGDRIRCKESGRFLSYADISYPVVNYNGGAHWFRLDWPKSVKTVKHQFARATILASRRQRSAEAVRMAR